jgi:hypothetical protein
LLKIFSQLVGHGACRADQNEGAALREVMQPGESDRSRNLNDGEAGVRVAEGAGQTRVLAHERSEADEAGGAGGMH